MSTPINHDTSSLVPKSRFRPATYSTGTNASGPVRQSLEDLFTALRQEIDAGTSSLVPECTTFDLVLGLRANLPLVRPSVGTYAEGEANDLPDIFKQNVGPMSVGKTPRNTADTVPHATVSSILYDGDGAQRSIAQRAASRGLLLGIQHVDGFKYSFNNAWAAKDHDGHRFSYICQDSLQNKDRHANGYNKTQKFVKGTGDMRGPRKETYDCKGLVSIKFSGIKQQVEIQYRHYAIHDTVADRQLLAMIRPASPRRLPQEVQQEDPVATPAPLTQTHSAKRKYDRIAQEDYCQPMSLADLLRQSSNNGYVKPITSIDRGSSTSNSATVYDAPSWKESKKQLEVNSGTATQKQRIRSQPTTEHMAEARSQPASPNMMDPSHPAMKTGVVRTSAPEGPRFINHSSTHPQGELYKDSGSRL